MCNPGWIRTLGALLVLGGCFIDQKTQDAWWDGDGDGVPMDEDCDPADAEIGAAQVWYPDRDEDGYGELVSPATEACEPPDVYVGDATDCDDRDDTRFPGAEELCGDGIVQDCDGSEEDALARCMWEGFVDLSGATAKLVGEQRNDEAGYVVSEAGDVNGDRNADLLVGAYYQDQGGSDAGAAYLVLGPVTGTIGLSLADAKLFGEASGDLAGREAAMAGDVDGDRYGDLLVGAQYQDGDGLNDSGAAYLMLGPMTGSTSLSLAEAKLLGEESGDSAGQSLAAAGDLDGDGNDDLLVGAYCQDAGGADAGAAYLVLGPFSDSTNLSAAEAKLIGEESGDIAGWSVATAGDADADGYSDVLLGSRYQNSGGLSAGAAYLVLGPSSGSTLLSDADARLIGEKSYDEAGFSVSTAHDMNDDGYDDLLAGAIGDDAGGSNAGAAYLVLGPTTGSHNLSAADAKLVGEESGDYAGHSVSTAADVNGDGHLDLLVGGYGADAGGSEAGAAWLVLGPISGTTDLSAAKAKFVGEEGGDHTGTSVSTAGDVDVDGRGDLLVGSPGQDVSGTDGGAAYLLLSPDY